MDIFSVLLQPRHSLHTGKSWIPKNFPSEWQRLSLGACRLLIVLLLWGIIQIPKKTPINLFCMWRKCQRLHYSCGLASDPAVSISDFHGVSDVCGELQEKPGTRQRKLVETWSSVSLPFVFYYFKEMLVSKSEGFNHLACEGVVSLISYTLVLASFKKSLQHWCHQCLFAQISPSRGEWKQRFPILKKKGKKNEKKKRSKKDRKDYCSTRFLRY